MRLNNVTRVLSTLCIGLALTGAVTLSSGCPKGGGKVPTLDETQAQNPTYLFQHGVAVLKTPNRDGVVDYAGAYSAFTSSAELFDSKGQKDGSAKAHFNAAWVAEILGQPANAEKHYRLAYEADPSYEKAMYSLARVLSDAGKHTEAVAIYKAQADKNPSDLAIRNDLVAAYSSAGQYEAAVAEAQAILLKDPKNATVYRNLSAMYYAQGNYGMSQLCAEKSLALNEGDPGTYNNMGVTFLIQEDEPAAIAKFQTAKKLDGDNFEANMNLGFVALDSGDYKLALDCFTLATTADPSSVEAKLGLAVALRGSGDVAKASQTYDEIIKIDPQNELAYFNAATLHEKYTKDYTKSLKYLQAYADIMTGKIGPEHKVFKQMEEVKASKLAEEQRLERIRQEEIAKKEREERALAIIKELEGIVASVEGKMGSCDAAVQEEVLMMVEQAKLVITEKDTGMAADVKSMFTDYYVPMVDGCAGAAQGGGEPTPEGSPTEPTEGEPTDPTAPGSP